MGLVDRLKELKNFRKTGRPEEGRTETWNQPYETLRKRWNAVPTTQAAVVSTARLLALPDEELLAEWEKARTDITGPSLHTGAGITRSMPMECAGKR